MPKVSTRSFARMHVPLVELHLPFLRTILSNPYMPVIGTRFVTSNSSCADVKHPVNSKTEQSGCTNGH